MAIFLHRFLCPILFLLFCQDSNYCVNHSCVCACVVTQSCQTCCNTVHCGLQAPLSLGILQARILEWVAMPSSRGSSQPRDQTHVSRIAGTQLCPTLYNHMDCILPGSCVHEILQVRILEWCHFLFQGIFLTQEVNLGLLHCKQILYLLTSIKLFDIIQQIIEFSFIFYTCMLK